VLLLVERLCDVLKKTSPAPRWGDKGVFKNSIRRKMLIL